MSGSGNSPNIIAGIERARAIGCTTVGMTGFDGGRLREMVDVPLHVEVDTMQNAQDKEGRREFEEIVLDRVEADYYANATVEGDD